MCVNDASAGAVSSRKCLDVVQMEGKREAVLLQERRATSAMAVCSCRDTTCKVQAAESHRQLSKRIHVCARGLEWPIPVAADVSSMYTVVMATAARERERMEDATS